MVFKQKSDICLVFQLQTWQNRPRWFTSTITDNRKYQRGQPNWKYLQLQKYNNSMYIVEIPTANLGFGHLHIDKSVLGPSRQRPITGNRLQNRKYLYRCTAETAADNVYIPMASLRFLATESLKNVDLIKFTTGLKIFSKVTHSHRTQVRSALSAFADIMTALHTRVVQ